MTILTCALLLLFTSDGPVDEPGKPIQVTVPLNVAGDLDLSTLVARLAETTGLEIPRVPGEVTLPIAGAAGVLCRKLISDNLGTDVSIDLSSEALRVTIKPEAIAPDHRPDWERRVRELAVQVQREGARRSQYGMHALPSYRPNDPARPTVCLVHGINSTADVFLHMVRPIEDAGFGIVVFDYAFNRKLDDSVRRFSHDWTAFRKAHGEQQPWAILGHSMGALVARGYVEGDDYAGDVSSLIMIAPVNQGSYLSRTQTLIQLLDRIQAAGDPAANRALSHLSDGLGAAASDMLPGSRFLKQINERRRRTGVGYHILAGDKGFLTVPVRKQMEEAVAAARRGILRVFIDLAIRNGLYAQLDELTDGTGDGCMSVDRTRLDGVSDHVVIHADHVELVRAPLFYPEPGPVVSMPYILRWLGRR